MPTRTIKFIGYTNSNINAVFTFNGNEVFNGAISAAGDMNTPAELFTFDIDQTVDGLIPGSITVTDGSLTVVALSANFMYSSTVHADAFEWLDSGENTSKQNITINDVAYDKGAVSPSEGGAWHVSVDDGDTMSCDWVVTATPTTN